MYSSSSSSHGRDVDESIMKANGWNNLGVVDTIFEGDDEDDDDDLESLSSPPLSFSNSSPSPLHSSVDAWTVTSGRKPDVKIIVRGICFPLHKDPLISKSSYLKRQLTNNVSEFTLSPPLKVSVDTFKQVADFCYINHAIITPFNVAALRTAADLLEMDSGGDESLRELTESYFCNVLQDNKEFTCNVFCSCLSLLPEAEQTAFLASRCIEALFSSLDGGDSDGAVDCADGLKKVLPEDFKVIVDSMQRRYTRSHDLLYRVVDFYFLVYNGKLSEDQKTQICSSIDCSILSASLLMHAVQNPRMPLRFVVQSMLIEQLNTHRTIFSALANNNAITTTTTTTKPRMRHDAPPESPATLGAILERDAALRQVAQLRAAVETTCSRIQTLEKELSSMKQLLGDQEKEKQKGGLLMLEDGRRYSSSCRFSNSSSNSNNQKVERGERGSISSSMIRFKGAKYTDITSPKIVGSSSSCLQSDNHQSSTGIKKNFGQRLIKSLRNAFGGTNKLKDGKLQGNYHDHKVIKCEKQEMIIDAYGLGDSLPHHRSHSVS